MDKEKMNNDELEDILDLNKKYEHYLTDEDADTFNVEEPYDENIQVELTDSNDEYIDISSYSEGNADFYMNPREDDVSSDNYYTPEENMTEVKSKKKKGKFFSRNKYRNAKITALSLVIVMLLAFGGGLGYFYLYYFSEGNYGDSGLDFNDPFTEQVIEEEDHDWQAMGDVDANSLNDYLYSWANNGGEKMYSKNVINVLLCGVDSETGKADSGRSDIMMLVSINKKTETITLVSLLRDSWTYMSLPKSNGSYYDHYFKLNSVYIYGGPTTLLNTIENNFKIEIDQFIAVDFKSFPKLIDALGGVTVEVQDYESKYIRRTSSHKTFPSGVSTLNGSQALIYSRIRKCDADSDISRTRRQRSVIKGLLDSAKSATNGQLLNAFKQVSPFLRTGYSQSEVASLIAQAYSNGWMEYDLVEIVLPGEDYVDRVSTKIDGHWAWVADYAACAQKLQKALYGETNIILDPDRKSVLDLVTNRNQGSNSGSGSNGNSGSGSNSGGQNSGSSGDVNSESTSNDGNNGTTDINNTDPSDTSSTSKNPGAWRPSIGDIIPTRPTQTPEEPNETPPEAPPADVPQEDVPDNNQDSGEETE